MLYLQAPALPSQRPMKLAADDLRRSDGGLGRISLIQCQSHPLRLLRVAAAVRGEVEVGISLAVEFLLIPLLLLKYFTASKSIGVSRNMPILDPCIHRTVPRRDRKSTRLNSSH